MDVENFVEPEETEETEETEELTDADGVVTDDDAAQKDTDAEGEPQPKDDAEATDAEAEIDGDGEPEEKTTVPLAALTEERARRQELQQELLDTIK